MKTFDWHKLASAAEIISSIAVLVTLIFLTVQVQQNTDAIYAQSRQTVLSSSQVEIFELLQNPDIAMSMTKPGELTREEHSRLHDWLLAVMRLREYSWLQYRSGIIDEDQWRTEVIVIEGVLTPKRAREWWESVGTALFNPEFTSFVDFRLTDVPASDEQWNLRFDWSNR